MWQQGLKDYFNFTRKERFGIITVVVIILLLIILPLFFPYFIKNENTDTSRFAKEIAQLRLDTSSKKIYTKYDEEYYNDYTPSSKKYPVKSEVFFFDPNTASVDDWIRLGIKPHIAQTIQKYISKGGKFYKPEDIKKIYGLKPSDAERLIPYVAIKETKNKSETHEENKNFAKTDYTSSHPVTKIDINLADTSQYIALPGIGSKLSKRIIAFREKLGGFYSIDQIGETYLLPDSTFQKIKPYLVVDSKAIKKMNINSASVEEMKSHPYIRYHTANAIFQYRQQHGRFNSVEEIKKIMTIDDNLYKKVFAYLTIE